MSKLHLFRLQSLTTQCRIQNYYTLLEKQFKLQKIVKFQNKKNYKLQKQKLRNCFMNKNI